MTIERKEQAMGDERPSYEAPRALRLSDQHRGTGLQACVPGSGDVSATCSGSGSGASGGCFGDGNTATPAGCTAFGNFAGTCVTGAGG